ncbi:MAG: hypothetical protein Q9215_006462 [Flavoplaca cf. flavocitrina]
MTRSLEDTPLAMRQHHDRQPPSAPHRRFRQKVLELPRLRRNLSASKCSRSRPKAWPRGYAKRHVCQSLRQCNGSVKIRLLTGCSDVDWVIPEL